jgi:hypothetical protein
MQEAAEAVLHDALGWVLDPAAAQLVRLCQATGMRWGPNSDPALFFYRSPFMHVFEFIVFHLFVLLAYKLSSGFFHETVVLQERKRQRLGMPNSLVNKVFGFTFLACFASQVYLKAIRPRPLVQLCWLFMPCHVITLAWAYILLQPAAKRNYARCVYLASVITGCHWGPTSAAAAPDWSDHQFRVEGYIFVLHHGLLVVMPVYFAVRYELLPFSARYLWNVTWVATLINVNFYTLLSYVSGLNINYHLYPPPKLMKAAIFATPFYRFYVIAVLVMLAATCRLCVGALASAVKLLIGDVRRKTKTAK